MLMLLIQSLATIGLVKPKKVGGLYFLNLATTLAKLSLETWGGGMEGEVYVQPMLEADYALSH